jgi:LPS sulfotransferase NodH
MLKDTGVLGKPDEWFNPESISVVMRRLKADSFEDYIHKMFERGKTVNNVFGVELTPLHYEEYLEKKYFKEYFETDTKYILLMRQDIVAQAISLWKANESKIFHSVEGDAQNSMKFSEWAIKRWVTHILQHENKMAEILEEKNLRPIRISYEFMASNPAAVINLIASDLIDMKLVRNPSTTNAYRKLADSNSEELAAEFYHKCHRYCAEVFSNRKI